MNERTNERITFTVWSVTTGVFWLLVGFCGFGGRGSGGSRRRGRGGAGRAGRRCGGSGRGAMTLVATPVSAATALASPDSTPMIWHDVCRHSYALETGLVVGFCARPHCCYRPY